MGKVNFMQERLVEMYVSHQLIVGLENGAGEFIPTTADPFPSVFTLTPSKAQFGPAAANQSWMHAHSVVNHVLGSAQERGRHVNQFMQTTVIRSTTSNNFRMKDSIFMLNSYMLILLRLFSTN